MENSELIKDTGLFVGQKIFEFSLKESFETITNLYQTIQQYREFSNPNDAAAWFDYVHQIFHIMGFSTGKVAPRLFSIQEMGATQAPKALVCIIGPHEDFGQITYGLEWESYLFFAAKYFQTDWVILTNGLQFKVLNYSKDAGQQKYFKCEFDEIIRGGKTDTFITILKIFTVITSGDKEKKIAKVIPEKKPRNKPTFSLEKSNFANQELETSLRQTLARKSDLTPMFVAFLEILLSEDRIFKRNEVKEKLFAKGVGSDIGQAGRYLSNLSQFLTKVSNSHLRQVIAFKSGGGLGQLKDDYQILSEYRELVSRLIDEWKHETA